ncbi:type II restriction endonuclease, partial [Streptococcus hyovaginalis]
MIISEIAEQKQIFEGAAHAFYWKPKLRIPDIYENEDNKKAFGQFLKETLLYNQEKHLIYNIMKLQEKNIKGLGPAVGNILYFLHPTIFPPFNTSIVKGFNMIFKQKIKLGSWEDYLTMREIMMEYNNNHNLVLSKDLGALAGLLYEIGSGRQVIQENHTLLLQDIDKVNKKLKKRHEEIQKELAEENEHTEMQY